MGRNGCRNDGGPQPMGIPAMTFDRSASSPKYLPPPRAMGAGRPQTRYSSTGDRPRSLQSIGDLAREFGVTLRTLRFYEDKGLLAPARRGTARYYGHEERSRLGMILKGKALGFTLREIREMVAEDEAARRSDLALSADRITAQIAHLEQQKADIEKALRRLQGYRAA